MAGIYRPQIAAYWKAVTAMTGITVAAGIYSTSSGRFIEYDPGELADGWERLKNFPQPTLFAAIG